MFSLFFNIYFITCVFVFKNYKHFCKISSLNLAELSLSIRYMEVDIKAVLSSRTFAARSSLLLKLNFYGC